MALVYNFYFSPDYAGQSAVVVNQATGSPVVGSPITLDADGAGSLSLAKGSYRATTSNAALGLGNSATDGVLDLADSITGVSGGGGVVIDAAAIYFEINDGVTLAPKNLTPIAWDTLPEGYEGDASQIEAGEGLHHVSVYLEFDQPVEDRTVTVQISSANSIVSNTGPFLLSASGATFRSRTIEATGLAIVGTGESNFLSVSIMGDVLDGAPTPADLSVGYGALTVTKIG